MLHVVTALAEFLEWYFSGSLPDAGVDTFRLLIVAGLLALGRRFRRGIRFHGQAQFRQHAIPARFHFRIRCFRFIGRSPLGTQKASFRFRHCDPLTGAEWG